MPERPAPEMPGRYGGGAPGVTLGPVTIASAWNVQGLRAAAAAPAVLGIELPGEPNALTHADGVSALWLGPGSWLVVSGTSPLGGFDAKRDALNAAGGALFDVSASRSAFAVGGLHAADVLAAGCPLDFHPRTFGARRCAQSVFARVGVLCCRPGDDVAFVVMVARSLGRDVWHALCTAAGEFGFEVQAASAWPGSARTA